MYKIKYSRKTVKYSFIHSEVQFKQTRAEKNEIQMDDRHRICGKRSEQSNVRESEQQDRNEADLSQSLNKIGHVKRPMKLN